jgi:hypothetical protein
LTVALPHEDIAFSKIHVRNEDYYFYPFNMVLDADKNIVLKSATVTPLCKLNNDQVAYVFYGDHQANYRFNQPSEEVNLITLSRREAMNAWKVRLDKDYLFVTEADVVEMNDGIHLLGENEVVFKSYPSLANVPEGFSVIEEGQGFSLYRKNVQPVQEIVRPAMTLINEEEESKQYQVDVQYVQGAEELEDYFLIFDYDGDQAEIYLNGEKVADHFYTGEPMEVSMRRFAFPTKVVFKIIALDEEAKIYLEHWPKMTDGKACKLKNVGVRIEFNHKIML